MKRNCTNLIDETKVISFQNQKKILVEMLAYVDYLCRQNNIKYSLIGGSLIGAIRHKGFIPWDDDIDIILDRDNYLKLLDVLRKEKNSDYEIFIPKEKDKYPLQFSKLINKKTVLHEKGFMDEIVDYGLFVDIFVYNYVPNKENERIRFFKYYRFLIFSLFRVKLNHRNPSFLHKIKRFIKNCYVSIFGYKFNLFLIDKLTKKYCSLESDYVIANNPVYPYEKEVQKAENIKEYIDAEFEGLKVMIFKNYDEILRTTFGDYMQLPPEDKRVNHSLEAYWKDGYEK